MQYRGQFSYKDSDGNTRTGQTPPYATRSNASYSMSSSKLVIVRTGGKWLGGRVVKA